MFLIKGPGCFLLRASTTQSRFSILGKKKQFPCAFFIPGFHYQMENNKAAPSAPPLWVFGVFQLEMETRSKKPHGNRFLFRTNPTFGPELKTDFGWCWPLIRKNGGLNKKHMFLAFSNH